MTPRTLREELRRMNREQLTAVAENWGISDPAGRLTGSEIRDLLVPRILNSVSLREKLDEAPAGTDLALRALIGSGGRFSAVRFAAMFGSVRAMGPDRFLRDAPWRSPESVSEWLIYHGFIFPGYGEDASGLDAFYAMPTDLVPFFDAPALPTPDPGAKLVVRPASDSEIAVQRLAAANFFDMVCLVLAGTRIRKPTAMIAGAYGSGRVALAERALRREGIIGQTDADGETIQNFLSQHPAICLTRLVRAWIGDQSDHDAILAENFVLDPIFHSDGKAFRTRIFSILDRLDASVWFGFRGFVTLLRGAELNFFRDPLDSASRLIRRLSHSDPTGWDAVEGELIKSYFLGPLYNFGFIDLAAAVDGSEELTAFRVTPFGKRMLGWLRGEPFPPNPRWVEPPSVGIDGRVLVGPKVSAPLRYHLARYCDWEDIRVDGWKLRLTPGSLRLAKRNGLKLSALCAALRRAAGPALPRTVLSAIESWDRNETEAAIYSAVLVSDPDPERISALVDSRDCAPWIVSRLNPTTLAIRTRGVDPVRRKLAELGVLAEVTLDRSE